MEKATLEAVHRLMEDVESLKGMLFGLYILVGLVGVVVAWGQRKIAKNQVALADGLRAAATAPKGTV